MIMISLARLQTLLILVKCECGNKVTPNLKSEYFDCTGSLRCEKCNQIVHLSEPRKCKNTDLTEGNVIHVYHSLSEGYGRAC